MPKQRNISSQPDIRHLLETFIGQQQQILEEFHLLHQRMDRLEGTAMLTDVEKQASQLMLSYTEAASRLGLSVRTLKELKKQGEIDCVQTGRNVRFSPEHLQAYKRKRSMTS